MPSLKQGSVCPKCRVVPTWSSNGLMGGGFVLTCGVCDAWFLNGQTFIDLISFDGMTVVAEDRYVWVGELPNGKLVVTDYTDDGLAEAKRQMVKSRGLNFWSFCWVGDSSPYQLASHAPGIPELRRVKVSEADPLKAANIRQADVCCFCNCRDEHNFIALGCRKHKKPVSAYDTCDCYE